MTDDTLMPCVRGCHYDAIEGEQPQPKPAKHGNYCTTCGETTDYLTATDATISVQHAHKPQHIDTNPPNMTT